MLLALHEIWPEAPLYTAVYDKKKAPWADVFDVRPTYLQNIPFVKDKHEWLAGLTSEAFRRLDFSEFDVVISVTSAEAKHIVLPQKCLHICYCLTPTRYLWSHKAQYETQGIKGIVLHWLGPLLRQRDFKAAQEVDQFVAISQTVQKRIKKYYKRESELMYPPVGIPTGNQTSRRMSNYLLVVSRLVPYKRIDLAIQACNRLKRQLIVVGKGSEMNRLKGIAGPTIQFTKEVDEHRLHQYYQGCTAVLFPGGEDFGMVPLEAQSFGKPVIAYANGGASETVLDGLTGILFLKQTEASLIEAIQRLETMSIEAKDCKNQANKFSKQRFQANMESFIQTSYEKFQNMV